MYLSVVLVVLAIPNVVFVPYTILDISQLSGRWNTGLLPVLKPNCCMKVTHLFNLRLQAYTFHMKCL